MPTFVAFLRAVNVGSRGIVLKGDLTRAFEQAGGARVRTFIQSGNVVFDAPRADAAGIVTRAQRRLRAHLGTEPVVMLRTRAELKRMAAQCVFADTAPEPRLKRYVVFLLARPRRRPRLPLVSAPETLEAVALERRDCYVLSGPKPSGMFGFPANFIEGELDVVATARNWSTITRLVSWLDEPVPERGGAEARRPSRSIAPG